MKKHVKKLVGITLAGALCTSAALGMVSSSSAKENLHTIESENNAKNVILLIGDGMGQTQVSAAAYFQGEGYGATELAMDQFTNVGYARTFSHDNTVTDSAAAATAFSAAHKTDNGVLGMAPENEEHHEDEEHFDVETVLEAAEKKGMSTGLVTTARITHATPAAFASHIGSRDEENSIAEQMLIDHDIDVLLGGGKRHFLPKEEGGKREDGKNLLQAANEKGYTLIENEAALENTDAEKMLGLFNNSHMTYELDRDLTEEPSLELMTTKALDNLEKNDNGFFLMVEGGRIDHAGHANYPATNIHETIAFDQAVAAALDYAKKDKNTLVIVSADHETGGMSIGANGVYGFEKDVISQVNRSPEFISKQLNKDYSNMEEVMAEFVGITDLKEQEKQSIRESKDTAAAIAHIISERALIGWTTTGHTAVDVPVYAYGPLSEQLVGTIDNTMIAEVISKAIPEPNTESAKDLQAQIQTMQENDKITSEKAARSLLLHVQTVIQFEEKEASQKVIKHLTSFKALLDHVKEKNEVSSEAYETLMKDTEALITKWDK